jgi:hypothetical protein
MNDALARAIDDGRRELVAVPDGHLPLPLRRQVRAALGGRSLRADLAIASAQRVLSIWSAAGVGDLAGRILADAARVQTGALSREDGRHLSDVYRSDCEALDSQRIGLPAFYAAYAAAAALSAALDDEVSDSHGRQSDSDLDPDEWEAALWASAAWSGGFPWENGSDSGRRREFWRWWLGAVSGEERA